MVQNKFYILSIAFKDTASPGEQRESAEAPPAPVSRGQSSFPAPLFPLQLRSAASVQPASDRDVKITESQNVLGWKGPLWAI